VALRLPDLDFGLRSAFRLLFRLVGRLVTIDAADVEVVDVAVVGRLPLCVRVRPEEDAAEKAKLPHADEDVDFTERVEPG